MNPCFRATCEALSHVPGCYNGADQHHHGHVGGGGLCTTVHEICA